MIRLVPALCLAAALAFPQSGSVSHTMTEGSHRMELVLERLDRDTWRTIDPGLVLAQGDRVRFKFRTNFDGYLYVMNQSTSGTYEQLFPRDETGQDNRIAASPEYQVPATSAAFRIAGPAGHEVVYWMVSPARLSDTTPRPPSLPATKAAPPNLIPRCDDVILQIARRLRRSVRRPQTRAPRRSPPAKPRRPGRRPRTARPALPASEEYRRHLVPRAALRPGNLRVPAGSQVIAMRHTITLLPLHRPRLRADGPAAAQEPAARSQSRKARYRSRGAPQALADSASATPSSSASPAIATSPTKISFSSPNATPRPSSPPSSAPKAATSASKTCTCSPTTRPPWPMCAARSIPGSPASPRRTTASSSTSPATASCTAARATWRLSISNATASPRPDFPWTNSAA